jgi:hypothetical protein
VSGDTEVRRTRLTCHDHQINDGARYTRGDPLAAAEQMRDSNKGEICKYATAYLPTGVK